LETPLHIAATYFHIDIMKILVAAGADISVLYGAPAGSRIDSALERFLSLKADEMAKAQKSWCTIS
jgi:ankyrin repeat protein